MMNHYVIFSGGFDSTLMLLQIIEENLKNLRNKSDKLFIVTFTGCQGKVKSDKEIQARKLILEYIKKKYDYEPTEIRINWDFNVYESENSPSMGQYVMGINQGIVWIGAISIFLEYDKENAIYIGYLKTDKAVLFMHELQQQLKWQCVLTRKFDTTLYAPLNEYRKEDIINELYDKHHDVIEYCITCESDTYEGRYCGECDPCNTFKTALYTLLGRIYNENKDENEFEFDDKTIAKINWINGKLAAIESGHKEYLQLKEKGK